MITGSALFFAGFGLGLAAGLGIALWVARGAYGDLRAHLARRAGIEPTPPGPGS